MCPIKIVNLPVIVLLRQFFFYVCKLTFMTKNNLFDHSILLVAGTVNIAVKRIDSLERQHLIHCSVD